MGLLPQGINNEIVQWRAKTKQVDITVHDASGPIPYLEHFDAAFYAKKYPIKANSELDISIGFAGYDNSLGKVTFDLLPPLTDIEPGDYVYEVVLKNKYDNSKVYTVVQDKFKILYSEDTSYGNIFFDVIKPVNGYTFTPNVLDMSINVNTANNISWDAIFPDWVDNIQLNERGPYQENKTITEPSENKPNDNITFNYAYGSISIDVSYYGTIIEASLYHEFRYDNSVYTFDISTATPNIDKWYLSDVPDWINVDSSDNTSIILSVPDTSSKVGSMTVYSTYALPFSIDVSYFMTLFTDPCSYKFNEYDTSILLNIVTGDNNDWIITNAPDWVNFDISAGTGNTSIVMSSDTSLLSSGEILFQSDFSDVWTMDVSFGIGLISYPDYDFKVNDYDASLYIETKSYNNWSISNVPNWLSLDTSYGSGDASINVTCLTPNYDTSVMISIDSSGADTTYVNYTWDYDGLPDQYYLEDYWTFDNTLTGRKGKVFSSFVSTDSFVSGIKNNALYVQFDYPAWNRRLTSAALTAPLDISIGTIQDYSYALWAKCHVVSARTGLVLGQQDTSTYEYVLLVHGAEDLKYLSYVDMLLNNNGSPAWITLYNPDTSINIEDEWHHYAITYDHSTYTTKFYFDSELKGTVTTPTLTGIGGNYIGLNRNENDTNTIDELYVYNKCIDASAIEILYNRV